MIRHRTQPGFTVIELLVAIAIAGFMIFMFNQLFGEVANSVSRGVNVSDFMAKSRAFEQQLQAETELTSFSIEPGRSSPRDGWNGRMLGPGDEQAGDGGILVVVQHLIPAPITESDRFGEVKRFIRSDQLLFIMDASGSAGGDPFKLPVLCPAWPRAYAGEQDNSNLASHVRLWYGHVQQTLANGTFTTGGNSLGDPADYGLGVDTPGNPNFLAKDWVLGRQAIFLAGRREGAAPNDPRPPGGVVFISGGLNNNDRRTNPGILPASPVFPSNEPMFLALADVSNQVWADIAGDYLRQPPMSKAGFHGRALSMTFTGTSGGPSVRLVTNPAPTEGDARRMRPRDLAQMHPYLIGGVSDFAIEFAHDYDNNLNPLDGYPSQGDGEIDRDPAGNIRWYSHYPNVPNTANFNPDLPVTYLPPPPADNDAYVILRNAVPAPSALGDPPYGTAAFIWPQRNGTGAFFEEWPWLIRIRYRLHDTGGNFVGRQNVWQDKVTGSGSVERVREPEPGQWFETIIPVNRQPAP